MGSDRLRHRLDLAWSPISDDPAFLHTTLIDELRHVVRLAQLSRDDLAELQRRAARHSFASPEVKAGLLGEIEAWVVNA